MAMNSKKSLKRIDDGIVSQADERSAALPKVRIICQHCHAEKMVEPVVPEWCEECLQSELARIFR